jgi:hypothetical protein
MPDVYGKRHDRFMMRYLETLEPGILNKELQLIGKHKSNYIIPLIGIVGVIL